MDLESKQVVLVACPRSRDAVSSTNGPKCASPITRLSDGRMTFQHGLHPVPGFNEYDFG